MVRSNNVIISHIKNNLREYTIASIIFIIGILFGIIFINNLNETQKEEINTYITSSITTIKESNGVNKLLLFKESIKGNFIFVIILWLLGSTVIGLLLVYLIVFFRGYLFRLQYSFNY